MFFFRKLFAVHGYNLAQRAGGRGSRRSRRYFYTSMWLQIGGAVVDLRAQGPLVEIAGETRTRSILPLPASGPTGSRCFTPRNSRRCSRWCRARESRRQCRRRSRLRPRPLDCMAGEEQAPRLSDTSTGTRRCRFVLVHLRPSRLPIDPQAKCSFFTKPGRESTRRFWHGVEG
jgi:hypothetical protein